MPYKHFTTNDSKPIVNTTGTPNLIYTGVVVNELLWFNINHSHSFCEIMYIINGSGRLMVDQTEYEIVSGDIIVINPSVQHSEKSNQTDPLHMIFFAFDSFQVVGLSNNHIFRTDMNPIVKSSNQRTQIEKYFTDLLYESENNSWFSKSISNSIINILILKICRMAYANSISFDSHKSSLQLKILKEYIDNNYTFQLSLESLADTIYINKYHLAHAFKKEMGQSPIQYVLEKRMQEACRLLVETELSIKIIASYLGYSEPSYFSQTFKHSFKESPTEYRSSHLQGVGDTED